MKKIKTDYDMNKDPMVKVQPTEDPIVIGDKNLSPVKPAGALKSKFGKDVMPTNAGKVTGGSSGKLQKASRLSGRISDGSEHKALS